jgi:hypothetical protein
LVIILYQLTTSENRGTLAPMHYISPAVYFRERFRSTTRQALKFICSSTLFFLLQNGFLTADYSRHSFLLDLFFAFLFGIPVGLAIWFIYRLARFAANR